MALKAWQVRPPTGSTTWNWATAPSGKRKVSAGGQVVIEEGVHLADRRQA